MIDTGAFDIAESIPLGEVIVAPAGVSETDLAEADLARVERELFGQPGAPIDFEAQRSASATRRVPPPTTPDARPPTHEEDQWEGERFDGLG